MTHTCGEVLFEVDAGIIKGSFLVSCYNALQDTTLQCMYLCIELEKRPRIMLHYITGIALRGTSQTCDAYGVLTFCKLELLK